MRISVLALVALLGGIQATPPSVHAALSDPGPAGHAAAPYDLCARGLGDDPHRPFTKNVRVGLTLRGATPKAATLNTLQAELVRRALWPEQASRVYVEGFDEEDCPTLDQGKVDLAIDLRPEDLAELEIHITRGDLGFANLVYRLVKSVDIAISTNSGPQVGAQSTAWLRVFYATNRGPAVRSGAASPTSFGADRVDRLSYGEVEVAVRSQSLMRENQSAAIVRLEKVSNLASFSVDGPPLPMERDAWLLQLRRKAAKFEKPGVLLFVHGYNVDFPSAAKRAAQLSYDLAFPGPTVFFAWPSDAATLKYLRDGRDAENSWPATARLLSDLVEALPTGPIYVVAHSMGNRVLLGGLASVFDENTRSRRAFREVVMAAPDVDQDYYRLNWARRVQNRGPRLTLYASSHDLALGSSEFLQGGNRLGMGGSTLYLDPDIDSVDASQVAREFFSLNHSYFGDSQTVLSDIFFLIRQGLAADRRPHLKRVGGSLPYHWQLGDGAR